MAKISCTKHEWKRLLMKQNHSEKSDFTGFEVVMEKVDEELEILITADGEIINRYVFKEDEHKKDEEGEYEGEDEESGDEIRNQIFSQFLIYKSFSTDH